MAIDRPCTYVTIIFMTNTSTYPKEYFAFAGTLAFENLQRTHPIAVTYEDLLKDPKVWFRKFFDSLSIQKSKNLIDPFIARIDKVGMESTSGLIGVLFTPSPKYPKMREGLYLSTPYVGDFSEFKVVVPWDIPQAYKIFLQATGGVKWLSYGEVSAPDPSFLRIKNGFIPSFRHAPGICSVEDSISATENLYGEDFIGQNAEDPYVFGNVLVYYDHKSSDFHCFSKTDGSMSTEIISFGDEGFNNHHFPAEKLGDWWLERCSL